MVDYENLCTASLYINNQLLSRGLLRDGQVVDFADPGRGHGGTVATMGRVIGIVNDLILRRDRDAEQRESLGATLRTLRAESLHSNDAITRLKERFVESQRRIDLAEVTENSLRAQLRTAETNIRALKEDVNRAKSAVVQTRTTCATETRRRDRQIEALKKQVGEAGRARGTSKANANVSIIHIVPSETATEDTRHSRMERTEEGAGYDLRSETNEFLAELARTLSEENDQLIGLVRLTKERLRVMSGWDGAKANADENVDIVRPSCEDMARDLDAIMEHLRTILTNPSFVPIEEVVVREEEIARLREGWVKMESRWKEAVHLIDGWRRRMAASGRPVNDEELKMGLRLSPIRVRDVAETAHGLGLGISLTTVEEECEMARDDDMPNLSHDQGRRYESLHLVPAPDYLQDEEGSQSDDFSSSILGEHEDVDMDDFDMEEPNITILQQSTMLVDSLALPRLHRPSPLRDSETAGNRGSNSSFSSRSDAPSESAVPLESLRAPKTRKSKPDFATIVEEDTWDLAGDATPAVILEDEPIRHDTVKPPAQLEPALQACRAVKRLVIDEDNHSGNLARLLTPEVTIEEASADDTVESIDLVKPAMSDPAPTMPWKKQVGVAKAKSKSHDSKSKHDELKNKLAGVKPKLVPPRLDPRKPVGRRAKAPLAPPAPALVSKPVVAKHKMQCPPSPRLQASPRATPKLPGSPRQAPSSPKPPASPRHRPAPLQLSPKTSPGSPKPRIPQPALSPRLAPPQSPSKDDMAAQPSTRPSSRNSYEESPDSPTFGLRTPKTGSNSNTATSRLPLPRPVAAAPPQQSPLTMAITAKLAASEREADAARVRAKLRAVRTAGKKLNTLATAAPVLAPSSGDSRDVNRGIDGGGLNPKTGIREDVANDNEKENKCADASVANGEKKELTMLKKSPSKKRNPACRPNSKVANRRRSTLSPWELESLIMGGLPSGPS